MQNFVIGVQCYLIDQLIDHEEDVGLIDSKWPFLVPMFGKFDSRKYIAEVIF